MAIQEFQEKLGSDVTINENKNLLELAQNRIDDLNKNRMRF